MSVNQSKSFLYLGKMSLIRCAVFVGACIASVFSACPNGWTEYANSCYKFQTDLENWADARAICKWLNSDLIAIETPAEQAWFVKQAQTFNHTTDDEGFWLGATDIEVEGEWVWNSAGNAPLSAYNTWGDTGIGDGQPNNRENREQCLAAVLYYTYNWSDEYCNGLSLNYVCEKKAMAAPLVG